MKRLSIFILSLCLLPAAWASDVPGLVVKQSPHSTSETLDRLENVLKKKGISIVTRWNHAEKAAGVDIPLRDTELLLFGNPALGSHMFTSEQTSGIDLPMKALAWEDADGQVWLGYNDPQYIADRHGIDDRGDVIKKMQGALDKLSDVAVGQK
ncbi:DUF302 domain-containing protein [Thiohalophilus thiocyanatoxydans]|uniref:Uncharacterized protein (DUF302 family) n=1 Tax=Thiohalophilus thiocyanatoxydans TaxID=381308 RepID=A0A4R8ITI4_9GAMM|nr:DUF302 domain-containing protein [Thiohalophilus thiocyanatoxydans]TDY03724.1 uncharacterized protein (DUF302 family) [Thiohalophilus thiocyanatoxydans]